MTRPQHFGWVFYFLDYHFRTFLSRDVGNNTEVLLWFPSSMRRLLHPPPLYITLICRSQLLLLLLLLF
jgi:hypothetical protein